MDGDKSDLVSGTPGTQTSLSQAELIQKAIENEHAEYEMFIQYELPKYSPIHIPENANIEPSQKQGYEQVKYKWKNGDYEYVSRWHTRTPNAPTNQPESWVVEKARLGIGAGKNARRREDFVLVGKTSSGEYKWVSKKEWNKAVHARKSGTSTKEQEEMLDNGHWKSSKQ